MHLFPPILVASDHAVMAWSQGTFQPLLLPRDLTSQFYNISWANDRETSGNGEVVTCASISHLLTHVQTDATRYARTHMVKRNVQTLHW